MSEELFKIPKIQFSKNSDLSKISLLFNEYGFVRIDGVFNKQEVEEMREEMKKIIEKFDPSKHPKAIFTSNEEKHVSDHYFLDSVDKISFFYEEGAIDENNGKLIVEKEKALNKVGHAQSMYIFKQPKIGGNVNEHVDSTFLHTKNPEGLIGIWIALDNAKIENGCLYFVPKSHKDFVDQTKNYKFVRNQENIDKNEGPFLEFIGEKTQINAKYIPIECESGSLLLIHGNVLHKSEKNTSNSQRHVYAFHLIDLDENDKWKNTNWLQENNEYKFPELFKNC
uniref:Phytanoyl-CoA dioxygenase n=1 Tax=Meloidogyne hapla TaxID=6305 RepID=A0A1I8B1T7_MELHA